MLRALAQILLNGLGVVIAAEIVRGISYSGGLLNLILVGLVIGLVNLLVKPIVSFFSLPLIIVTLGLFYLAINGAMFMLAAAVIPQLTVQGCAPAILGGLVLAIFNWAVRAFASDDD